ncbi:MAG: DnaJ domain-containing protein [Thermodesulfovibrionales bacterium]|nr:DnaJ domain-containing protein [Thermodesulfovibrionales bacterium]
MMKLQDERRRFRRYKRETPVTVIKGKETFHLRLLDYSPLGVRIKTRPLFYLGESLEIVIDQVHFTGHVVWVSGDNTGIAIDGPVIAGDLSLYRLWDLLIGIRRTGKTGVLNIQAGDIKKTIYIKSGDPIFARSSIEDERLGEFLLRKGIITLDAYNHSVALMKNTGKRQGAVLVEAGYIKVDELPKLVREQIEDIIKNTFKLLTGRFEFIEGPLPSEEIITLKLSLANLIYRGIKGLESFQFIRSELHDLNAIPVPADDPYHLFQDIELDERDKKLLLLIDGRNTIDDIIKKSGLNHFEALKTVYALLCTRIIELKEYSSEAAEEFVSMDEVLRNGGIDESFLKEVEEIYNRIDTMTHYEILGIKNNVSQAELKKAYYSLVKKFHPDRYFRAGHDDFKNKLSKIFTRINNAYTVLSDSTKRSEYDASLSKNEEHKDSALMRFEQGLEFYKKKSFNDAVTAFGQAVYLDSTKPKYHFYYGLSLMEVGKYKDAERSFLKAIELWPDNPDYVTELGFLYLRLDMKLRAKKTFERALAISPGHRRAKEGLEACS